MVAGASAGFSPPGRLLLGGGRDRIGRFILLFDPIDKLLGCGQDVFDLQAAPIH